jgi:hypothetical protein
MRTHEFNPYEFEGIERLMVFGDIHGDLRFIRFIKKEFRNKDLMITLGDYADRGSDGVDVIETIDEMMNKNPGRVYPLKGNHEDYNSDGWPEFYPVDLQREVEAKRGKWGDYFKNKFSPFVEKLYVNLIIPNEMLFVHGGVSSKIKNKQDLIKPSKEIEKDILWSDPFEGNGETYNRRGFGVRFGEDITENVCKIANVKRILRSHEPKKAQDKPFVEHNGKIMTLSSTSCYNGNPFVLFFNPKNFDKYEIAYL